MDIKGSYRRRRDTRTVILNGCNDCPSDLRQGHLCFNSLYVTIAKIVELQCFFNKVASAPQSAVIKSAMYVLLQAYYLEDL
jgi:hypothetical protein